MTPIRKSVDEFLASIRETVPSHWSDVQPEPGSTEESEFEFLPMLHFLCRDGSEEIFACPLTDARQKTIVAKLMKVFAKKLDAIAVALITEAWTATDDGTEVAPRDRPDRKEVLLVTIETVFACHSNIWEIKREEGRAPELAAFRDIVAEDSRFFGVIEKLN